MLLIAWKNTSPYFLGVNRHRVRTPMRYLYHSLPGHRRLFAGRALNTVGHLGESGLLGSHMQSRKWYGEKPSVGGRMSSRKGESKARPRMGPTHTSGQLRSLSGKKCSRIGCSVGRRCGEQRIGVGPTYGCSHLNGDVEQRP